MTQVQEWGLVQTGPQTVVDVRERDRLEERINRKSGHFWNGSECWEWTGGKSQGYGHLKIRGKQHYTHRLLYEAKNGPIPDGLEIDHLCRNRACCNPGHLEAVTPRINALRGATRAAHNAARTECENGHPFTVENTYSHGPGWRACRACARNRARAYRARKRAA